jgi:hypothetical protein
MLNHIHPLFATILKAHLRLDDDVVTIIPAKHEPREYAEADALIASGLTFEEYVKLQAKAG